MQINEYVKIEKAANLSRSEVGRLGSAIIFIVVVMIFTGSKFAHIEQSYLLVAAAVIGAYMAINIGANDVANNVGPAVGSFALTLTGAIVIAAIFEAGGAIIAGGDVVSTVKKGIIDPANIDDPNVFVWVMMGALMGAAIWLNAATWLGAPVSTTHSIVGGVMGAGIAAAGWDVVNWDAMAKIALSWVISPVTGGIIAAAFLFTLKKMVFFKDEPIEAAKRVVPVMIAIMAWAFTTYIALKGLSQIVKTPFPMALLYGLIVAAIVWVGRHPDHPQCGPEADPDRDGVNRLFTLPLIFSAALLSFAHGANDVANAVGPLAGVVDVLTEGTGGAKVAIPLMGHGDRGAWHRGRPCAVRAETDPHGRVRDHRTGPLARVLHRAGRRDHRDRRQPAGHADQFDPCGAWGGVRRRVPARVSGTTDGPGRRNGSGQPSGASRISGKPRRFCAPSRTPRPRTRSACWTN